MLHALAQQQQTSEIEVPSDLDQADVLLGLCAEVEALLAKDSPPSLTFDFRCVREVPSPVVGWLAQVAAALHQSQQVVVCRGVLPELRTRLHDVLQTQPNVTFEPILVPVEGRNTGAGKKSRR